MKFAAISKYSVTQKPSRFQVREILKQEDKFKPPYFQSTLLIPTFPAPKLAGVKERGTSRVTRRPSSSFRML